MNKITAILVIAGTTLLAWGIAAPISQLAAAGAVVLGVALVHLGGVPMEGDAPSTIRINTSLSLV